MKIRVKRAFRDKYTKKLYKSGDIIAVSDERFTEIFETLGSGYVEIADDGVSGKTTRRKNMKK